MLPIPAVARLSVVLSVLLVSLSPLLCVHMYSGAAEVPLVYGENAPHGRFFEFNPGEKSPGVTAPGYMLLLALFYRVFPATSVPAVVKGLDIVCWYVLIGVVFLLASRLFGNGPCPGPRPWSLGSCPGRFTTRRSEWKPGSFAFVVFLWIYLADRRGWFAPTSPSKTAACAKTELALGALLG